MDKMIVIYLEAILRIIKRSKEKEETLDGLIMQIALLEKIREILNNTLIRLTNYVEQHTTKREITN